MITLLLSYFSSPARIAGAAALVALIALSGFLKVELIAKEHALVVAAANARTQDSVIGQLRQGLASDESALAQFAKLGREAAAEQEAANARAKAAAVQADKTVAALKAAKVPADCAGAAAWAGAAANDLAKGWGK